MTSFIDDPNGEKTLTEKTTSKALSKQRRSMLGIKLGYTFNYNFKYCHNVLKYLRGDLKRNLVLKKTKLLFNLLTMGYFNLDHNNKFVV